MNNGKPDFYLKSRVLLRLIPLPAAIVVHLGSQSKSHPYLQK
ncbi:hypothetical protein SAMN05421852_111107 [Thermoflavimicrobium dichotomicum]|uniref:Uncharacterized protein n=1 Tax=Thermoflavimicrobium dichotomicum TaxID=46223 RepID=A0A1I3S093_9BACL|nr:hypothetical protein SAMN05421852_111107 [Thermoflavimicrobium dichotomicum]